MSVLVAANPTFGLDFAAVAEIRGRIAHETPAATADLAAIGRDMAGHGAPNPSV